MALPKIWGYLEKLGSSDLNGNLSYLEDMINALVPVGSVKFFDDLNGVNSIDSDYWSALNGQVISDAASVYDGKTLQDVSGRYICGYGVDGDGLIASASWSAAAVGNASHQIDIQHSHVVAAHNHKWVDSGANSYDVNGNIVGLTDYLASNSSGFDCVYSKQSRYTNNATITPSNSLSSSQSIQPSSIRMRAYIRIK